MVLEREDLEEKLSRFFVVEEKDGTYSAAFDILIMDGLPNDLRTLYSRCTRRATTWGGL